MSRLFVAIGPGAEEREPAKVLVHSEAAEFDKLETFRADGLVAAVASRFTEPEDHTGLIVTAEWLLALDGRVDARAEIIRTLELEPQASSTEIVLKAVQRWGDEAPGKLLGDFAFVAIQRCSGRVLAARDAFGVRPLVFASSAGTLAFGSTERTLLGVLGRQPRADAEAVAWALSDQFVCQRGRTLFRGVSTVPPGSLLSWHGREVALQRHFFPDPSADEVALTEAEHARNVRAALGAAVMDQTRSTKRLGGECSGGLDSGVVLSIAATQLRERHREPLALIHTRGVGGCDELPFASAMAKRIGADLSVADWVTMPFLPVSAPDADVADSWCVPARQQFAELRSAGVRVVLTGQGSDELQSAWGLAVEDAVARGRIGGVWRLSGLSSDPCRIATWRQLGLLAARELTPRAVLERRHERSFRRRLPTWLTARARDAATEARREIARANEVFAHTSPMRQAICAALVHNPSITWIATQNQAVASFQGVDTVHPFLDKRVVAAFLALPTELRTSAQQSKPFLRRLYAAQLPPAVAWRTHVADYCVAYEKTFQNARESWLALTRDPRLSECGWVEPRRFAQDVRAAWDSGWLGFPLRTALRLEAFLRSLETAPPVPCP